MIVSSGKFYSSGGTPAPYDTTLVVTQNDNAGFADARMGQAVRNLSGNLLVGQDILASMSFSRAALIL